MAAVIDKRLPTLAPCRVKIVDAIPRNSGGKVLRDELGRALLGEG